MLKTHYWKGVNLAVCITSRLTGKHTVWSQHWSYTVSESSWSFQNVTLHTLLSNGGHQEREPCWIPFPFATRLDFSISETKKKTNLCFDEQPFEKRFLCVCMCASKTGSLVLWLWYTIRKQRLPRAVEKMLKIPDLEFKLRTLQHSLWQYQNLTTCHIFTEHLFESEQCIFFCWIRRVSDNHQSLYLKRLKNEGVGITLWKRLHLVFTNQTAPSTLKMFLESS